MHYIKKNLWKNIFQFMQIVPKYLELLDFLNEKGYKLNINKVSNKAPKIKTNQLF